MAEACAIAHPPLVSMNGNGSRVLGKTTKGKEDRSHFVGSLMAKDQACQAG
jgi:hypothetical protein